MKKALRDHMKLWAEEGSLLSARAAAFLAVLRGDRRVVVVSVRDGA